MAADVVVGADLAAPVADDDDLLARDVEREEVARLGHLLDAARDDPLGPEDPVALAIEVRRVDVGGARQRRLEGADRHAVGGVEPGRRRLGIARRHGAGSSAARRGRILQPQVGGHAVRLAGLRVHARDDHQPVLPGRQRQPAGERPALAVDAVHQLERRPRQLGHRLASRHPDRRAAERGEERRVAVHDHVRRAVVERGRAGAGGPDRGVDGVAHAGVDLARADGLDPPADLDRAVRSGPDVEHRPDPLVDLERPPEQPAHHHGGGARRLVLPDAVVRHEVARPERPRRLVDPRPRVVRALAGRRTRRARRPPRATPAARG